MPHSFLKSFFLMAYPYYKKKFWKWGGNKSTQGQRRNIASRLPIGGYNFILMAFLKMGFVAERAENLR